MSANNPNNDEHDRNPADIPLQQGPITREEQARIDQQIRRDVEYESEQAFKNLQVTATEAANRLSSRSILISIVSGVIAIIACAGNLYQGHISRKNLEITRDMLQQMKVDSADSSREFQTQLGHFDASLGVTQVIAEQSTTQATQTTKLAGDTHDLAVTAGKQADAAKEIAVSTKTQSEATQNLANSALKQADAALRQADAASGQLKTMQIQLELTNRPWLKVTDLMPHKDFGQLKWYFFPNSPLGELGVSFYLAVQNIGGSAAINAWSAVEIYFLDPTLEGSDIQIEQDRFCGSMERQSKPVTGRGTALFPGEQKGQRTDSAGGLVTQKSTFHGGTTEMVNPIIVGCVSYQFQASSSQHQTRFIYRLRRIEAGNAYGFKIGEDLTKDEFAVERVPAYDYAY